jgi:riboflavin biosynthesis pyrimidine reductase
VRQLTDAGLIDEYNSCVHPVAIGEGYSATGGTSGNLDFKVVDAKQFRSGSIFVLTYGRKINTGVTQAFV